MQEPSDAALRAQIDARLDRPVAPGIAALAAQFAARPGVLAVLFYGNLLRQPGAGGLADLYVLTAGDVAHHGPGLHALGNRLLPPNVYFAETGGTAAKVAVLRLDAFARRMRRRSWDTTLWARFVQPVALLHARDAGVRAEVVAALAQASATAGWWAAQLAPPGAEGAERWAALFAHTYGAELRVEGAARPQGIVGQEAAHFAALDALLPPVARAPGHTAAWTRRRRLGKLLNAARLVKAAMTFRGGIAYALAKVERHGGAPVALKAWERRLPWLAAPFIVLRLLRQNRLR